MENFELNVTDEQTEPSHVSGLQALYAPFRDHIDRSMTDLRNRGRDFFLVCQHLLREENQKNALLFVVALIGTAGIIALFSTAFSTCSKVSLYNKTGESVLIYNTVPYGTKVSSSTLFPYTSTTIKFNGVNSYADLYTTAGKMHFSHFGKNAVLEDGANNKAIEAGNPPIVFWVCNQNYIKTNDNNETTSSAMGRYLRGSRAFFSLFSDDKTSDVKTATTTDSAKLSA